MSVLQVFRNDGLKRGADIVETLLSEPALIYRGTAEMDANAAPKTSLAIATVYRGDLSLGQLLAVSDTTSLETFKAKVTGISLKLMNGSATQSINLERVLQ